MVVLEIFHAAESGNIDFLKQFDSKSLNDLICDPQGRNCLHYAARRGGVDLLKFLVDDRKFQGNKRSNVGATAAHDAAAAGNIEAVKWLLEHGGCNPDDQDGTGATILHLSCRFQHTRITEWLLDTGKVDVTQKTASGGLPLHFAVVGGDFDAVKLLLEEDPSTVNLQLNNGATPTYLAAQEGHLEILRTLIQDHRGNTRMKSYDGMSCVHAAAQCGHLDCVRFLVDEERCNVNERDFDGATPLHFAASQGHHIVIDWLMKIGKAAITLDNLGGSPLHNAAENNNTECVKVLIGNGCSIVITDNNGLTAAELARQCYHDNCANLIQTFQPGQFILDEDVAYLHSVQSPRVNPVQISGYNHNVTSHHINNGINNGNRNGSNSYGNHGNHNVIQHHREHSHNAFTGSPLRSRSPVRAESPVFENQGTRFGQDEADGLLMPDDHGNSIREGRRNNSQLWSTDGQIDTENNSLSASSLSSLSNDVHVNESVESNDRIDKPNMNKFPKHTPQPYSYKSATEPFSYGNSNRAVIQEQFERRNVKFVDHVETINDTSGDLDNDQNSTDGFVKSASAHAHTHSKPDVHLPNLNKPSENQNPSVSTNMININHQTVTPVASRDHAQHSPVASRDRAQHSHAGGMLATSPIPPPPPPPPPAAPPAVPALLLNGSSASSNPPVPDEVKRKSASLPARSASVFTADMIQSKRSTLSPVSKTNTNSKQQNGANNEFIQELKQATKGSALRKTNVNELGGKPLTPAMNFTSGSRKVVNNNVDKEKDSKDKLVGEWDPKNFIDQVPNRDILPAWKVQLQAKQIAEKVRKETLEKREIEEQESRFKNMPAWKRALIEKKEAEARALEEKKMQQVQQQNTAIQANRKTPTVSVVDKSGENKNLAPWQRELQKR